MRGLSIGLRVVSNVLLAIQLRSVVFAANYFPFVRPGTRYTMRGHPRHWNWGSQRTRHLAANSANTVRLRGRHLLDQEAITCLLVLLFVDEPRLNTQRLYRVFRNLCHHPSTRHWVIRSLLAILHRTNECKAMELTDTSSSKVGKKKSASSEPAGQAVKGASSSPVVFPAGSSTSAAGHNQQPSWLSIRLDAALGCRTNVFQIHRTGKKQPHVAGGSGGGQVYIHPQASPVICRNVLDTLISLAKSFPQQFLPLSKAKEAAKCDSGNTDTGGSAKETDSATRVKDGDSSRTSLASTLSPARVPSKTDSKDSSKDCSATGAGVDFWDVLVRLDGSTANKKGKSVLRLHSTGSLESETGSHSYNSAPLGQLMNMLSYPVVRRSQLLTDRLLRLLGLVSVGLPDQKATAAPPTSAAQPGTSSGNSSGKFKPGLL